MKRILLVAAFATALAVPAGALADRGHGAREHARINVKFDRGVAAKLSLALNLGNRRGNGDGNGDNSGTTANPGDSADNNNSGDDNGGGNGNGVLRRYAENACKAERASLGDDAFKTKYGSEGAMQACITAQVGSSFTHQTRTKLVELSSGTLSGTGTSAVSYAGTLAGTPIAAGTISVALTVGSTSSSDACKDATGTVTITDSATSTNSLTENVKGRLCTVGTGTSTGTVFFGRYEVSGGSGTFASAKSKGILGFFQQAGGTTASAFEFGRIASS